MPYDLDIEAAVNARYGAAATAVEQALCCPVEYDPQFLKILPDEIIERDYGCGDPSAFVKEGETVLDLGSGGGKICYIASQIVGRKGSVIGIDTNLEMLSLAKKYRGELGEKIGYSNVDFRYGKIQDLKLDLELVDQYLKTKPIRSAEDFAEYETFLQNSKAESPLIADKSIDVILSNCVLNLVRPEFKIQMFEEMFRVLKRGGRVAVSDIVADEDVPQHLQDDPELWSGCISGAFREDAFIEAFEKAGFYGMEIVKRDEEPWQTIEGIEFRAVTIVAYKGKQGECLERNQAVIYKGPWKKVLDDDGHMLKRGARMAVCDKTFKIFQEEPYASEIVAVEPIEDIPLENAGEFDCQRTAKRHPRESKGLDYKLTETGENCGPDGDCC
ncbi:MAG: methyltransferase domain-containing protein [Pyrinomonadaceae bacterium]|nr:methyltransferase domain-containing protein [Pyrinomonadaceae bacterium]